MITHNIPLTGGLLMAIFAGGVGAQTVMVTTAFDEVDIPSNATIPDLPGPDGVVSLREALLVTDNTPGHQTVAFQITPDQFWLPNIYPEFVLIQGSFGFGASDTLTLNGTTQTPFTGDTNPDGHEVVIELGVGLGGDNSEAFGFHGCNIGIDGNNSVLHDNTGAMDLDIAFGTGNVIRDNEADTIRIIYADGNTVIRNTAARVRIWGLNASDPATGNVIGGPDPADRNYITGWGNVGEHGSVAGTTVELLYTDQTLIQNNWIGTTPDGMSIGNFASTEGIGVYNLNINLTIRDNLIATQAHWGGGTSGEAIGSPIYLQMYLGGSNIVIQGNTLGLNALGEPVLGGAAGITVARYAFEDVSSAQIGGTGPGEGNVIAGHETSGVLMIIGPGISPVGHIRLSGNSIYANGEIGIDLTPNTWTFGPTPNDPLDADVGANGLQNYPVISAATRQGGALRLEGVLASEPFGAYTIEFFASPACDASGFGQGQEFLGSIPVSTNIAGDATFDVLVPATVPDGWVITSTATREPFGSTSEFSACTPVTGSSEPGASVCFGDGSGNACPCGNESSLSGRGCKTTAGQGMYVTGAGSSSIAADDCALSVHDVPVGNTGIFYTGQTGLAGTPLFDGLQCAGGSSLRFGGKLSVSSTVTDTGFVAQDPSGTFWVAGTTYTFQYFTRDLQAGPSPCGGSANLSSAYAMTMTP